MANSSMRALANIRANHKPIKPGDEFQIDEKEAARLEKLGVAERIQKPAPAPKPKPTPPPSAPKPVEKLKPDELKALAKEKGIELADNAISDDIVDALKAAGIETVE